MTDKRTITLPCFNIQIRINNKGGSISSDLHDDNEEKEYKAAVDTLESLVLSHACSGVDIESFAYLEGVETTVDAVLNRLT